MRTRFCLALALGLIVSTGCDKQLVAPTAEPVGEVPAFNFNNNPYGGSIHIFRSGTYVFYVLYDTETSLAAVFSSTPDCGGILEPADLQRVAEDPYDPIHSKVRELTLADPINIFIVDLSQAGACFGFDLFASGTGKATATDSDFYSFFRPNNNANAFGFMGRGTVVDADGGTWQFSGHERYVWDGEDFATLKANAVFNLNPRGN